MIESLRRIWFCITTLVIIMAISSVFAMAPPPALPDFKADPFSIVEATMNYPYSTSLANSTADPNISGDLTFTKVSGPAWLTVHKNGALTGTPSSDDEGLNSFIIHVISDEGLSDTATFEVAVVDRPVPVATDPGTGPWQRATDVEAECNLDPALLEEAGRQLGYSFAIVRYGKLCYEHYALGVDLKTHVFSTTKTLGAVTVGALMHQSRDIPMTGRKTGPLTQFQKVDHWLDLFLYNQDATIAHVLGMEAHNLSLDWGRKNWKYDTIGTMQINSLSDIINRVVQQDSDRLGGNIGEFYLRHVAGPLGFEDSNWGHLNSTKIFATSWESSLKDMARLGLLVLNGGKWNGERLMDQDFVYNQTHVSFEDGGKHYGYLTWLSNGDDCTPDPVHTSYPHGVSGAPDCQRSEGCDQTFDVGVQS